MKNSKKTVRGLRTELFKKYQTDPKVTNPSSEIANLTGISLADIAQDISAKQQEELMGLREPVKLNRYPVYSEEQKAKMKKAFGVSSEDLYKKADVLGTRFPKLPSSGETIDQTLAASEKATNTPSSISNLQNNTAVNNYFRKEKKKPEEETKTEENPFDWRTAVRLGVAGIGAGLSLRDDIENRDAMNRRIQAMNNIARPMFNEYTNMGRPGSTQIIYASHGAEIRTGTNTGAEEAELEKGEYFILPDGESYVVGGKKHSQGGEKFILPDGTIVFSDYLKIPGTSTTFAQEARKYDLDKYEDVLENPHAKSVDRNTAQIMFERNSRKLQELFQLQQSLNGNSNGELKTEREGKKGMLYGQAGFKINRGFRNLRPTPAKMVFPQNQIDPRLVDAPSVTGGVPYNQFASNANTNAPGSAEEMSNLTVELDARIESALDNLGITDTNARSQFKNSILSEQSKVTGISLTGVPPIPIGGANRVTTSKGNPMPEGNIQPNLTGRTRREFTLSTGDPMPEGKIEPALDPKINNFAQKNPSAGSITGAKTEPIVKTTSQATGANNATSSESGTVTKGGNASAPTSEYYTEIVDRKGNKRKVFVEGQGEFKGKNLRDQYGNDVFNLVRNRLNENYDELSPRLLDAYQSELKNKNLGVNKAEDLVFIMESGNNALVSMRNYFKGINKESKLFDIDLDLSGKDGQNAAQQKTVELFKEYIESNQFAKDAADNPGLLSGVPWIKGKIVKSGNKYTLEGGAMDTEFVEKYQAAYKAFGGVKAQQPKGKGDMLRGFRIAPEGLSDHQWMGLPISPVDLWGGNTTIGQISAWEDEEPPAKKKTEEEGKEVVKTAEGEEYNTKVGNAPTGAYEKAPFDIAQLAPEFYGLANAEIFPYMLPDITAPYVMPQTLNIQPQLQDVDNSYMAALRAGADPNAAFMSTLNAKQKLYSEKQNYDAQQRAQADVTNASYRWQEDVQDMQSLDRVYNTLIAASDDARTTQIQDIVRSASNKRAVFNAEEARKKLYIDNFVRNYKWDGKTGEATLNIPEGYDPLNLASIAYSMYNPDAQKQTTTTTKSEAAKPSTTTTSTTYVSSGYTPAKKKNEKQVTSKDKNK